MIRDKIKVSGSVQSGLLLNDNMLFQDGPGVRADCTLIGRYFDGLIHSSPALHVFRQQRKHKIAPDAAIGVFFSPRFDPCFGLTDSLSFFLLL